MLEHRPGEGRPQGPAAAGTDVPRRHRRTAGIIDDEEIKSELAAEQPYAEWLHAGLVHLDDLPAAGARRAHPRVGDPSAADVRLHRGGAADPARADGPAGAEPIGSMGTDTPIAVLSDRPRLLFDYFSQLFAQVTNPPLDAIREELVTSLGATIGPERNMLEAGPASCRQLVLPFPVIDNDELAKILHINARRRPARLRLATSSRASTRRRAGARRSRRASTRSAPRSRGAIADGARFSCCPTATPTTTWRRSRRCC